MSKAAEELLAEKIVIKSPKMLFDVAESLRDFIKNGLLKQIGGTCSIDEIIRDKAYPDDIINIEFATIPAGTRYILSCETYHGIGGVFKKMPNNDD